MALGSGRLAIVGGCAALALLSYFYFPGHTWLQQDTQIYAAILEHQWNPAVLRKDILVSQPNVAFTLYDEAARALRTITGLDLHAVLAIQQILARALGIWGFYLMALATRSGRPLLVASICALGATIVGPAVLTFEYEPTPRAFAIPLVMCAIGLLARERYLAAGFAGAVAFLYHPPSALPFCMLFGIVILVSRKTAPSRWSAQSGFLPVPAAAIVIAIAARGHESSALFGRIPPFQEQLQQTRAAYNWISMWPPATIWHYLILFAIVLAGYARLRRDIPTPLRIFVLGLPILGVVSMPVSWLLLERFRWVLIPQLQPMRTLLFVALMAQFLGAACGVKAALQKQWIESAAWFAVACVLPLHPVLTRAFDARSLAVLLLLAMIGIIAARYASLLGAAAFFVIPVLGGIVNYPSLHTPELEQLSRWARMSTPPDAVFLFPDAGHALDPGIFRAEALRAVYVDWKGGGQVNYSAAFAEQWARRWQLAMGMPIDMQRYAPLSIDYVVLPAGRHPGVAPVFENARYVVCPVLSLHGQAIPAASASGAPPRSPVLQK